MSKNKFGKSEETNFMYFLREIWRKKVTIILIAVVLGLLMGGLGYYKSGKYVGSTSINGKSEAESQIIIRDDQEKQVIIDHKNDLMALLTSSGTASKTIVAFNLPITEAEFITSTTVKTYGTSVIILDIKLTTDADTARNVVDYMTDYSISEYQKIYPDIQITRAPTHLVGEDLAASFTVKDQIVYTIKYFAIGLFIGLAISIIVVGLWVVFSNKINTESDLENASDLPIIANIPSQNPDEGVQRTAVFLAGRAEKSIAVLGTNCADKRFELAVQIGKTLTQTGRKVLVLNTVFSPDQNSADTTPSLSSLLSTEAHPPMPGNDCTVLAAGYSKEPFALLSSQKFARFYEEAKSEYDMILCVANDLATASESLLPAVCSDASLYVAECRKTSVKQAEKDLLQLRMNQITLLGSILLDV